MSTRLAAGGSLSLPSARTLLHLMIGGFAGLGFWEFFAAVPTAWAAGFPLQPPELVKSLFSHRLGVTLSDPAAHGLHYVTGFLFYPIGYWIVTRWIRSFGMPADGWIWGVVTYFIALGFFAPLAGQSFLLRDVPVLSFMSLIGHAIYGYIAAWLFELLEKRAAA
jgi:hypothetical protein